MEKKNAKQFPCIYYARHMETGLCGYENETILIDTDNIKNMIPTFIGKPVYVHHQEVDMENLKEQSHGYVTDSFYNEMDGWLWVKMLLVDDIAMEAVANGWSVSNAYVPTEWGAGGVHHNMPYDRKIVSGEFTHMAIVPNPRYEEAGIFSPEEFKIYQESKRKRLDELKNAKPTKEKGFIMKLFKNKKEETTKIEDDTMVELKNDAGESIEVSVKDMAAAVLNAKKNEAEEEKKKKEEEAEKANMDMMVKVGDEDLPLRELMNRYQKLAAKKNESDEDEEEAEEETVEDLENEEDEDKKKDDEKKNSKSKSHFEELKNANKTTEIINSTDLGMDQLARGQKRYGSAS